MMKSLAPALWTLLLLSTLTYVPILAVHALCITGEFYKKLGFVEGNTHTPEGRTEPVWAWLKCGGAQLMLSQATEPIDPREQAMLFYVYCEDALAFRSKLLESGVAAGPISHPFYAPRGEFRVTDPDGHTLMVTHT